MLLSRQEGMLPSLVRNGLPILPPGMFSPSSSMRTCWQLSMPPSLTRLRLRLLRRL